MRKKRISFRALFFLSLFICVFCYLFNSSSKIILNVGANYYNSKILNIAYSSLGDCLKDKSELENVVIIERDKDDNINYISSNTYKLNLLATTLAQNFKDSFNKSFSGGVSVPVGAFTGISLFSGIGKNVKMNLIVITNVKCEFYTEFKEAGINQTRHVLKLFVIPTANIVTHKKSIVKTEKIEVILYDNLIIGKVPSTYLNGKILN